MRRVLSVLGSLFLLATGCSTLQPARHVVAKVSAQPSVPSVTVDQEVQRLLAQLSELSNSIERNMQSPQVWRYQLAQGDILVQLASLSKAEERDHWLRSAVDSYRSAAALSRENDLTADERLIQLAGNFADSRVATYAVLQQIQADSARSLAQPGVNPVKAHEQLRDRLVRFAQEFPQAPEAPSAIFEAGQISEGLGKPDDARQCYRYLNEYSTDRRLARVAATALWRLGLAGETVQLKLPLLYETNAAGDAPFDLGEVRGKMVITYFWSSANEQAAEDFQALRLLTDRYRDRGLEVVYVNLDDDSAQAKSFLAGRLLAGVHVFQRGGLNSPIAQRYCIPTLPQAFLIGKDGVLIRHTRPASELEPEIADRLACNR